MYVGLALSALCLVTQGWAQHVNPTKCATGVHVLSLRGHGGKSPPYGLSVTAVDNITAAISGSDVVPVPFPSQAADFFGATITAAANLKKYIKRYHNSCPDTKLVIQGYSQGAISAMNAFCGGNIPGNSNLKPMRGVYAKYIDAIVLYGDETGIANAPYDAGTCTNDAPYARTNFNCGKFEKLIRDWCDSDDPECCKGGQNDSSHYAYPERYDYTLTRFVVEQYDKRS